MEADTGATPTRRAQLATTLGIGSLLVGGLAYIGFTDPHQRGSLFPPCPFYHLTGWYCPGCGGLRMTHDILHGDFSAAIVDNVFLLFGLPVLAAWVLFRRHRRQQVWTLPAIVVIVVAAIAWTVVRNLPGFPLVPTLLGG